MGEALYLVSVLKGLERYPNPLFWAVLYTVFLCTFDYMFQMALGQWKLPLLLTGLNFGLSFGLFTLLKEAGDGWLYWAVFCAGFVGLVFFMP